MLLLRSSVLFCETIDNEAEEWPVEYVKQARVAEKVGRNASG